MDNIPKDSPMGELMGLLSSILSTNVTVSTTPDIQEIMDIVTSIKDGSSGVDTSAKDNSNTQLAGKSIESLYGVNTHPTEIFLFEVIAGYVKLNVEEMILSQLTNNPDKYNRARFTYPDITTISADASSAIIPAVVDVIETIFVQPIVPYTVIFTDTRNDSTVKVQQVAGSCFVMPILLYMLSNTTISVIVDRTSTGEHKKIIIGSICSMLTSECKDTLTANVSTATIKQGSRTFIMHDGAITESA